MCPPTPDILARALADINPLHLEALLAPAPIDPDWHIPDALWEQTHPGRRLAPAPVPEQGLRRPGGARPSGGLGLHGPYRPPGHRATEGKIGDCVRQRAVRLGVQGDTARGPGVTGDANRLVPRLRGSSHRSHDGTAVVLIATMRKLYLILKPWSGTRFPVSQTACPRLTRLDSPHSAYNTDTMHITRSLTPRWPIITYILGS